MICCREGVRFSEGLLIEVLLYCEQLLLTSEHDNYWSTVDNHLNIEKRGANDQVCRLSH